MRDDLAPVLDWLVAEAVRRNDFEGPHDMPKQQHTGFTPATIRFLTELRNNNNRDWFNANKHRYENDVVAPSLNFITVMDARLKKISPHFRAIPKKTGGSLMRVYRDTRFAKDKTPYKTNIGIQFRHELGKDVHAPGFYVHVEPNQVFLGVGIWRPDPKALGKIRGEIHEEEASGDVGSAMLITKRHFNFAMSRARRSVSEKDLALFEEFAEKQRAGRGEAANNFKFGEGMGEAEDEDSIDEDLYA